jgi:predicted amidohydrolase YtcJ
MRTVFLLLLTCAAVLAGCQRNQQEVLVVTNARIWTGDPALPEASAFVVRDGKFMYVGDAPTTSPNSKVHIRTIDAHGARIIPGLIDAHIHLVSGGLQLMRLNLRDVPDRPAFIGAVAVRAKTTPRGEWILGGRWSTESWADPAQPTKEWIDAVTLNNPVLLSRMDGHGALANSVALQRAGITKDAPPDPPGGNIERDPKTGEPTGILKDTAIELIDHLVPKPDDKRLNEALARAIEEAHRHGLTGADTMSEWTDLAVLERARKSNKLNLRVRMFIMEDDWEPYLERGKKFPNDDQLRVVGVKGFADGSLGSRTAYMSEPYSDNPPDKKDWRGLPRPFIEFSNKSKTDPNRDSPLDRLCWQAEPLSIAVHCIGDQANSTVLGIYARRFGVDFGPPEKWTAWIWEQGQVAKENPVRPDHHSMRIRIEHAQHLLPSDIPQFARLGVVASMQPYHKADDGRYAEKAIGPERCKTSYAFRSLLDSGAHLAFGSDWPVVSLSPFLGVHAAVTGKTLDGKVFVPEQNITVEEAIRAYTSGAAYASGDENRLGQIKTGYLADFVILGDDPFAISPDKQGEIRVRQTFVGGIEVWNSSREKK